MSVDMSQFFGVFFEESHEHLDDMEHLLLEMSLDDPDIEDLNSIFRAAHSIKGGSGVFGFDALTGLTHVMENILDLARKNELTMTKIIVDQLLVTVDTLKSILICYQNEDEIDWGTIEKDTKALEALLADDDAENQSDSSTDEQGYGFFKQPVVEGENEAFGFFEPQEDDGEDAAFGFFDDEDNKDQQTVEVKQKVSDEDEGFGFFEDDETATSNDENQIADAVAPAEDDAGFGFFDEAPSGDQVTGANASSSQAQGSSPVPKASSDTNAETSKAVKDAAISIKSAPTSDGTTQPARKPAPKKKPTARGDSKESSSIRVDTGKIDSLVNLVGELVITQSMIKIVGKEVHGETEERLDGAIDELSRNIREIQEAVMSMRMLPMSFAFNRFPRVVRDLADKLGKKVNLIIEGGSTEIDKGLIEKLVDPLTHLVRNSIDHGVETPEIREASGKSTEGTVILAAEQRGGSIIITITDDGAGLNRDKIMEKAMNNGLDVNQNMPDSKVWSLIFEPGFSTAEQVTDVSGRGVGMDVVRRNIEGIGGAVEIESHQGVGSVFTIRLPLTLAILDGMCVSVNEQIFVVPLTNIIESMQPQKEQLKTLSNDNLLWVRDEYWPIVPLHRLMGIEGAEQDPTKAIVVLVETSRKRFAILVDELSGQQQVVIKSLEQHYRRVPGVAGATIMGDGSVAMILDVESIANEANIPTEKEVSHVS